MMPPSHEPKAELATQTSLRRKVIGALRRWDAVLASALIGIGLAPVSSAYLCAEASCRSAVDASRFYGLGFLAAVTAGLLFWRVRRWPLRALVLGGALFVSYLVPIWVGRHGRWMVPRQGGGSCLVRIGADREQVRAACGKPTYWCTGPKYVDSADD